MQGDNKMLLKSTDNQNGIKTCRDKKRILQEKKFLLI